MSMSAVFPAAVGSPMDSGQSPCKTRSATASCQGNGLWPHSAKKNCGKVMAALPLRTFGGTAHNRKSGRLLPKPAPAPEFRIVREHGSDSVAAFQVAPEPEETEKPWVRRCATGCS